MAVSKEQMAVLVEVALRDAEGYRDQILEGAGEEPFDFEDYPESIEVETQSFKMDGGVRLVIHTRANQKFVLNFEEINE